MSLLTPWGYTVTDADALSPLLTPQAFDALTANKYAGDTRLAPHIAAASAAIRNYCGWHVAPSHACEWKERMLSANGRVKRSGTDIIIQLPAAYVSLVSSVLIGGEPFTDFALLTAGLLRLFDAAHMAARKTEITVAYTAGLPGELTDALEELAAGRVVHGLASTPGIASESAGGVSVSYSQGWSSGGGASVLQSTDVEVLAPYRLLEVF